jgi:Protein of unknown function (DUF3485)
LDDGVVAAISVGVERGMSGGGRKMCGDRSAARPSAAAAVAMVMLLGIGVHSLLMPRPADAREYQHAVATAAATIPMHIGDWVGQDVPVPSAAVTMLSPNVLISRHFVETSSGADASLLLVQCGDARDMTAHYPPVCYCNAGWSLVSSHPRDWLVAGDCIPGTEYEFSIRSLEFTSHMYICNFMELPDGRIVRDMTPVIEAAGDVRHRYFGAAQVQVVMSAEVPQSKRDQAVAALVGALEPTLKAIGSGGGQ